jgi:hypothetical protein
VIKAVATTRDGRTAVFLGLSRENTDRLHDNKPMVVRLRELHPALPDLDIVLLAGETEVDIREDLRVLGPARPEGDPRP